MYRQRIKSWRLDNKNLKDREMRVAVRKIADRVAEGKSSDLSIRGQNIDYQKVVRHWKRKDLDFAAVLALRSMSKTPDGVECLTPLPSPIMTPEVFAIPEQIIRMLRNYHQGSFEAGTWRSVGQSYYCESIKGSNDNLYLLDQLSDRCRLACQLFNRNAFEEGRRVLDRAFARVKRVILTEQPDTFILLLKTILLTCNQDRPGVGTAILNHISAMGGIILGDQHPFKLICGWLASLDLVNERHTDEILHRSAEAIHEIFKRCLGPLHRTTIRSLLDGFEMMTYSDQCTENQEPALRNLLHECETALGQDDGRTLMVHLKLGLSHLYRGEYAVAQEEAQAFLVQNASYHYRMRGLEILAASLYGLNEIHEAFRIQRQVIDPAIRVWGAGNPHVQQMMLTLEMWMEEQGMPESAAQVKEEGLRGVDYGTDSEADDMDTSYDSDAEWIEPEQSDGLKYHALQQLCCIHSQPFC